MFLPCPHCGFLVALIVSHDGPAQRCPRCDGLLSADPANKAGLAGTPEPVAASTAGDAFDTAVEGVSEPSRSGEFAMAEPASRVTPEVAPATRSSVAGRAIPSAKKMPGRARRAPSFVRHAAPIVAADRRWPWLLAVAALALVLALQLLLTQRHELAATARWRPLVTGLCGVLQCDVPPWREPAAFTMLGRNVQPKPNAPGVLTASASFRNDARWAQPWPTLSLSLSDIDGQQVGLRAFSPDEYRGDASAGDELAPGQSATVQFDVIEPAPRIVAFTFDFQ